MREKDEHIELRTHTQVTFTQTHTHTRSHYVAHTNVEIAESEREKYK